MARSNSPRATIKFTFNNNKRLTGRSKVGLTSQVRSFIERAAVKLGREKVLDRLRSEAPEIKKIVEDDLAFYIRRALRFFLDVDSPNTAPLRKGKVLYTSKAITFDDSQSNYNYGAFTARNFGNNMSRSANQQITVVWDALQPATIRRKRRRGSPALKFFRDSGALASALNSSLGSGFSRLLSFNLKVEPDDQGNDLVRITALPGRSVNRGALGALAGGSALASSASNGQIIRLLQIQNGQAINRLIEKLDNGRGSSQRPQRPLLQPILGFWLVKRLPYVFRRAVQDTI